MSNLKSYLIQKLYGLVDSVKVMLSGMPTKALPRPGLEARFPSMDGIRPSAFITLYRGRFAEAAETDNNEDDAILQWMRSIPVPTPSASTHNDNLHDITQVHELTLANLRGAITAHEHIAEMRDLRILTLEAQVWDLQRENAERGANFTAMQTLLQQQTNEHRRLALVCERAVPRLRHAAQQLALFQVRFDAQRHATEELEGELMSAREIMGTLWRRLDSLLGGVRAFLRGIGDGEGEDGTGDVGEDGAGDVEHEG